MFRFRPPALGAVTAWLGLAAAALAQPPAPPDQLPPKPVPVSALSQPTSTVAEPIAPPAGMAQPAFLVPADPPPQPAHCWFAEAELGILFPYVHNNTTPVNFGGEFNPPAGSPLLVGFPVPTVALDATASPRVALGYRFQNMAGEILLAYRNVSADGRDFVTDYVAGPSWVHTWLEQDIIDLTYGTGEQALGPDRDLRWEVGGRYAYTDWLTRAVNDTSLERTGNTFNGGGLVGAVNFGYRFRPNLGWYVRAESSSLIGGTSERFFAVRQQPDGSVLSDCVHADRVTFAFSIAAQAALSWTPPWARGRFLCGYQVNQWWLFSDQNANSDVLTHGLFLRWDVSY